MIKKVKDFIDKYLRLFIDNYLENYFEYYFIKFFGAYFKEHSKPLFLAEDFNNSFDKRLQETFLDEFNISFDKMLNSFNVDDKEILETIQLAETRMRKGNGEEKLKFVCAHYAEKRKEEIMRIAEVVIKERVVKVFNANKEQVNSMILEKPICL